MTARKLTIAQKEAIQGVFFNENTFFNCVQNINDEWYLSLSKDDEQNLINTNFSYLLNLDLIIYEPKVQANPF